MHAEGERFDPVILHQYILPLLNPVGNHIEKVIVVAVRDEQLTIWEDQAAGGN